MCELTQEDMAGGSLKAEQAAPCICLVVKKMILMIFYVRQLPFFSQYIGNYFVKRNCQFILNYKMCASYLKVPN